jgi:glucose-1-phosphate thymidylyltransferase
MEVLILAAGFGTRLYPLTKSIPKALVKINKKPAIEYIIDKVKGIPDLETIYVLSNNRFHINFVEWLDGFKRENSASKVKIINNGVNSEVEKKGAVADIKYAIEAINPKKGLLILACDGLFEFDLKEVIDLHKEKNSSVIAIKMLPDLELIKKYSCVTMEEDGRVSSFMEKPENPISNLCSIACYMLTREDLNKILNNPFRDMENMGNIVNFLTKESKVYGKCFNGFWIDVGSFEELDFAEKYYRKN